MTGQQWSTTINALVWVHGCQSVLDYGCGQGSRGFSLRDSIALTNRCHDIREYDPAILGKDARPEPADLVVCADVLDHVEPDTIESVLDHLCSVTQKVLFVVVSYGWWRDRFARRGLRLAAEPSLNPGTQWAAVLVR